MPEPRREKEIFEHAMELASKDEQQRYIERACQGDIELLGRVQELWKALEQAGAFLVEPGRGARPDASMEGPRQVERAGSGATPLPPPEKPPRIQVAEDTTEKPGDQLGHFLLVEKIGEGGCGVVYLAEQLEPVRRRVALKVVKLGMDTRQVVARFGAERQALALMDHPNIAKVFDAGATHSGRPYFVMELVQGLRITQFCDERRLPLRERLGLFLQVCSAIQHAHQKGIIHRDIKPSNILVTLNHPNGAGMPKVIDFGIAKATQGTLTNQTLFTRFEQFLGTPAYMSPEQAEMGAADIDTRSDIYSLGVVLYELLTGQTPFDSKALLKRGIEELILTLREVDPPSPSRRLANLPAAEIETTAQVRSCEAMRLIHGLRGDLDWIVMKCLEKDPARRYDSVEGLARDINSYLTNRPVAARPPSVSYRFGKAVLRHRSLFAAGSAVTLTLVLGLAASLWQAVRTSRAEGLASRRLAEAEAVSAFLTQVFQSPDPERDGRAITVAETLRTAAARLDSDLTGQPARRANLQLTLGRTYLALGLADEALPLLRSAHDYRTASLGPGHPDTLLALQDLALSCFETRRVDEAIRLQEELLSRRRRLNGPDSPEVIPAMLSLANSYAAARRGSEALALRESALRLSRKVHGSGHPDTVKALHGLALSYPHAQALALREEAFALSRKVNGPDHPSTFRAAHNLELSYSAVGRDQDALALREELVRLSVKLNGPEHPLTQRAIVKLEEAYYAAGRWQDALRLKADTAVWDPKNLNTELAVVQLWFGKEADYEATCRWLLKFAENTEVPTTAERVAKVCLLRPANDPDQMKRILALARRAVALGADHQFLGWFQLALGMAEYRAGNYPAADEALSRAANMAPVNARFFRAMSLFQQGQPVAARRLFDEAVAIMRPLPDDDLNPLASGASGDDMIAWMAYREAKTLMGVQDSGPAPVTAWVRQLQDSVASNPEDTIRSLHLSLVLYWVDRRDDYESFCRQNLEMASASKDPTVHDRAAKAYLLQSRPQPETLKLAVASAHKALELAKPGDPNLPWFLTVAGAAAFREGNLPQAETLLGQALNSPVHENQRYLALAFRAMTRSGAGRLEDAQADLAEIQRANLPAPDRTRMSAILREQDKLAVWIACEEAKAALTAVSAGPIGDP